MEDIQIFDWISCFLTGASSHNFIDITLNVKDVLNQEGDWNLSFLHDKLPTIEAFIPKQTSSSITSPLTQFALVATRLLKA